MSFTEMGMGSRALIPEHNRLRGVTRSSTRPAGLSDPHPDKADTDHTHASAPLGVLGYAEVIASQTGITSDTDLTGLSKEVTVGTGRLIRITATGLVARSVIDGTSTIYIKEGAAVLQNVNVQTVIATQSILATGSIVLQSPSAGLHTYNLSLFLQTGTGTTSLIAASHAPASILIEDIGAA